MAPKRLVAGRKGICEMRFLRSATNTSVRFDAFPLHQHRIHLTGRWVGLSYRSHEEEAKTR